MILRSEYALLRRRRSIETNHIYNLDEIAADDDEIAGHEASCSCDDGTIRKLAIAFVVLFVLFVLFLIFAAYLYRRKLPCCRKKEKREWCEPIQQRLEDDWRIKELLINDTLKASMSNIRSVTTCDEQKCKPREEGCKSESQSSMESCVNINSQASQPDKKIRFSSKP
ncbi:uncharacterized protein LOC106878620 isoform X2 [Octopus bimaculoides]|uniref:Uncharacterized protein n=1 Tax=Octopus bimaculoides TaxID=37653 RepID=A0A0L8G7H5_OCTBM|nr:uncharacterized protein LOC106878620 isoform X2 [Octopus bimaculoides]|eukprot:XP_014783383.1 PREDICTED: uncharacterized protein LOC106878620 isoform X2 [Octopus bimaculoides]